MIPERSAATSPASSPKGLPTMIQMAAKISVMAPMRLPAAPTVFVGDGAPSAAGCAPTPSRLKAFNHKAKFSPVIANVSGFILAPLPSPVPPFY